MLAGGATGASGLSYKVLGDVAEVARPKRAVHRGQTFAASEGPFVSLWLRILALCAHGHFPNQYDESGHPNEIRGEKA